LVDPASPLFFQVKLTPDFYIRPTLEVARNLLGKVLVRKLGHRQLSGIIVETEAYVGPEDLACHASKGRTARTAVMFEPGGRAYVYMIYGFYFCLNVVTEPKDFPAAVLIRAVDPVENVGTMRRLRNNPQRDTNIASGPGKLCMAMAIDKKLNGADLTGDTLWIENRDITVGPIDATARIGIDYAGEYKDKPWRFSLRGNPHLSRKN
jgi:DNA-3-methyladenine glycosylase